MANNLNGYNRKKKRIPEMLPVKKWLSLLEDLSFMDMSINRFQDQKDKVPHMPAFFNSKNLQPFNGANLSGVCRIL